MSRPNRTKFALTPSCQALDARIAPTSVNAILAELSRGAKALNGGADQVIVHHHAPAHSPTAHATHAGLMQAHHPHKAR